MLWRSGGLAERAAAVAALPAAVAGAVEAAGQGQGHYRTPTATTALVWW